MAAPGPCSVSAALQEHLRHLTLQDFPCGLGSWNKSRFAARRSPHGGQPGLWADPARQEEDVPLGEESPEALIELLKDRHSPWALPPGCSPQDQLLREVAVLEPKLVHGSNVFQVLRSLRLVDKGVEEVDAGLLQLQQLEELILSANHISRVDSANLPQTLKVLELCCNAVADLQDLCAQPPPELQHLGLGYNRLCGPLQDKCLTAAFWPNLVSLDLSFNNLTDLLGLVSQLSSLEKLRILVLKGNPLALIPTYRGFLVDSLPKLSVLDDIHVGFDERHQFLGLASQPELMRSEARVVVSVGDMKGVPDPSTLQELADDSDFPVITYSYCVTYEFVEGEEFDDGSSAEVTKIHESLEGATLDADSSAQNTGETKNQQEPAATEEPKASSTKVFVTPGKPWEDAIDCSYRKEHIVKDLMGLKSYLAAGTIVSVVEEKVLSWPVEGDPEENIDRNKKAGWRQQKDGARGPVHKDKQKKKKKACEFRSDPPIRKTLATRKVTLEALLATEDLVTALCDFGILITEKPPQPPSVEKRLSPQGKKKSKDKSKTPKAESKSQAKQKASTSAKGKIKKKGSSVLEEGQGLQPVPLTVQFQMQLLRWPLAASAQSQESVATAVGSTQ
ncbi:leucine-rich repeat-containing protein 43 isoform X2 [Pezoporus flaviventris]|uniref:leucine-rich repeat-containing protein 43 isoform X2 n=1 Tax=Pezoporus flaviventris TaxID=889875 RepID=UPI002AAFD5F8|nr:leucine-rich repeat-containing protein 43 isoform X2 [Pezoporus flaviventris]